MAKRYSGYSKNEIKQHLLYNGEQSDEFMRPKLTYFREVDKLFNNIERKADGLVRIKLLRAVVLTRLSLSFVDGLTNKWDGRTVRDNDIALSTQALYDFDSKEIDFGMLKWFVELETELYGVGCVIRNGRDSVGQNPKYIHVPTKSLRPDPFGNVHKGFEYMHIHGTLRRSQITKENGYMNIGQLDAHYTMDQEKKEDQQVYANTRNLSFARAGFAEYIVPVQYCFETFGGIKHFIVTAGKYDVIIKMVPVAAVRDEEKKDPSKIEDPYFLHYNTILPNDPMGESTADVVGDKQRAMQMLTNLNLIKAKDSALGKHILFNENVIDDISKLTKRKEGTNYIGYDPDKLGRLSPNDIVVEVQDRPLVTADSYNAPNIVKQIAYEDVGLDAQGMGVAGDGNKTATENQRVQANSNIRQILHSNIRAKCRQKYAWDWLRCYHENFDYSSKKNITLNKSYGRVNYTVTKKDLPTRQDINLTLVSKAEKEIENRQMRENAIVVRPMILENPSISQYAKTMFMRRFIGVFGIAREQVMGRMHLTKEEMKLNEHIEMLNKDELPNIPDINEDLMTYRLGYEKAFDTKSKIIAIERIDALLMEKGINPDVAMEQQQPAVDGMKAQGNIATNGLIQQGIKQEANSLADIRPQGVQN